MTDDADVTSFSHDSLSPVDENEGRTSRDYPIIHRPVEAPFCSSCANYGLSFFDIDCPGCLELISQPETTIAQLFAVLRQWTPQVQWQLDTIVEELFIRDAHVDDRDGLTDMTLLHYASKSGAQGDESHARKVVELLLNKGASIEARCRWTDMTPLHYSVYFDVPAVVEHLVECNADMEATCSELDHGTCLHIAATQLALNSAKILIKRGAKVAAVDDLLRLPFECLPPVTELSDPLACLHRQLHTHLTPPGLPSTMERRVHSAENSSSQSKPPKTVRNGTTAPPIRSAQPPRFKESKDVLPARKSTQSALTASLETPDPLPSNLISAKVTLQALGLNLGERVKVGSKAGLLRYCGPVEFAPGVWAGVELDEASGKNNGCVAGVQYFICPREHGIFAPIGRVSHEEEDPNQLNKKFVSKVPQVLDHGSVDVSHVAAKVDTGLQSSSRAPLPEHLGMNDRVIVAGQRKGTIRFIGETQFSQGIWYGVELDKPAGKNDGSVEGFRYFNCKEKHGIFTPLSRLQKVPGHAIQSNASSGMSTNSIVNDAQNRQMVPPSPSRGVMTPQLRRSQINPIMTSSLTSNSSDVDLLTGLPKFYLREGLQVLCSNEIGYIRYIGRADFAEGIWLGIELKSTRGKNDGEVLGKRYFTCRPGHGLMVRPSRITVRGINGSKLLPPELIALENFSG